MSFTIDEKRYFYPFKGRDRDDDDILIRRRGPKIMEIATIHLIIGNDTDTMSAQQILQRHGEEGSCYCIIPNVSHQQ